MTEVPPAEPADAADLPEWLRPLVRALAQAGPESFSRYLPPPPPPAGARASAVLILLGTQPQSGPDVLLIERATTLRSHAGQPAFPGGAADPGDGGPVATALREAAEEVGLRVATVRVVALLPELWLPPSGFVVAPVLAWWRRPHPVAAIDRSEVERAVRVPLAELADPANRIRVRHPSSGYVGAAFEVRDMLVWGFTAGLLDRLLALGGWERAWDAERIRELPAEVLELARRTAPADAPRDTT